MTSRKIICYPHPDLRKVSQDVELGKNMQLAELQQLVQDMFETMYEHQGIGLAAVQIGVHFRVIVIDLQDKQNKPLVLVNPRIEFLTSEKQSGEEGCLSIPGYRDKVARRQAIRVFAKNANFESFEMDAENLLAICIQHEIDHINGKLFIDSLPFAKRKKFEKLYSEQN